MFTKDKRLIKVLINSGTFVMLLAPMHLFFGLLTAQCAYSVVSPFRMRIYRFIMYLPIMVATSAVAIAWTFIFDRDFGILNYYLKFWA